MQNNGSISVVIPTYNRASSLRAAVKSALDQTRPPLEILICDDGSTDNSKEMIHELNDPRLVWIDCGRNGGPAIPRNTGIRRSRGEWIAFLDSDDTWLPEKLEKQMEAVSKHKVKASCSNAMRIKHGAAAGLYFTSVQKTLGFKDLLAVNSVMCSSALVNRQLLLETPLFPEKKEFVAIEDYALWLKVSCLTRFVFSKAPLLNYTDDPAESIRKEDKSEKEQRTIIFTELEAWLSASALADKKELTRLVRTELKKLRNGDNGPSISGFKRLINSLLRR